MSAVEIELDIPCLHCRRLRAEHITYARWEDWSSFRRTWEDCCTGQMGALDEFTRFTPDTRPLDLGP